MSGLASRSVTLHRLDAWGAALPHLKHGCGADVGVDFVAADVPNPNHHTVGIMALVAEDEGLRITARTSAALASGKARHEAGR